MNSRSFQIYLRIAFVSTLAIWLACRWRSSDLSPTAIASRMLRYRPRRITVSPSSGSSQTKPRRTIPCRVAVSRCWQRQSRI